MKAPFVHESKNGPNRKVVEEPRMLADSMHG